MTRESIRVDKERSMSQKEETISQYFRKILNNYDCIRGKDVIESETPYWDVVVITTADKLQNDVYEEQLKQKYERKELPLGVPIHVIHDPPGHKIGNGGSTLLALKFLDDKYGDSEQNLLKKRVMLIHAGGQSQRMPSASVLGKIFSPIPKGNPIYQMLDIKLAMFCPLIPFMCPGVFVTCADDFLVYRLDSKMSNIEFSQSGFTALAHPSTLAVGTGHGVYVIKDIEKVDPKVPVQQCKCLEVLQKPSESVMYSKGAVLQSKDLSFCDGIKISGRAVYTDSSFFFAHNITKKLLKLSEKLGPLTCEIDAYGDFLQALGPNSTDKYINNTSNVSRVTPDLLATRKAVYSTLKGSKISLIVMNCSKFLHIGTTKEYIEHFCCDTSFQEELGLSKDVFNFWIPEQRDMRIVERDITDPEPVIKKPRLSTSLSDTVLGCVMHSVMPVSSSIPHTSVVEYCNFSIPVNVGQNCIVSNCEFVSGVKTEESGDDLKNIAAIEFPNDIFIHTIPVTDDGKTKYATVVFDIKDNLKKVAHKDDILKLAFLGKYVEDYMAALKIDQDSVISSMNETGSKVNLWYASLFPLTDTMSQSLRLALQTVEVLKKDDLRSVSLQSFKLVSMATILKQKDVFSMLRHRNGIYEKIKLNCG